MQSNSYEYPFMQVLASDYEELVMANARENVSLNDCCQNTGEKCASCMRRSNSGVGKIFFRKEERGWGEAKGPSTREERNRHTYK